MQKGVKMLGGRLGGKREGVVGLKIELPHPPPPSPHSRHLADQHLKWTPAACPDFSGEGGAFY